jgi:hypothetical protein
MAKKTKEAKAPAKKTVKVQAPVDPVKTKNLIHLLNILALLLAITAFLLQLFAVLSHHWKWQTTDLQQILSPGYHYSQPNVYEDSQLNQNYGLTSRTVKLYANKDEQLSVWSSTRFPRIDDGEDNFHNCLSQTSTLSGVFRTCSKQIEAPAQCHCRRYLYWNFVIVFEVIALVLLGIVVFLTALLSTEFQALLKLAAAGLALVAFIFLLVGLILIVTHLKRETRSFADAYPHIHQRLSDKLAIVRDQYRGKQSNPSPFRRAISRRAISRRASEFYRAYPLLPGQHPYNESHFQEYSEQARSWVYKPYSSIVIPALYQPQSQQYEGQYLASAQSNKTAAPSYNKYGPVVGYDQVYDHTKAGLGWSTILSIIATALALLLPLILLFSWLTGKKLTPNTKTVTTTVKAEYTPLPTEVPIEVIPAKPGPVDYTPQYPISEAVVTARSPQTPYDGYGAQSEPVIVRDVIIRDEQPVT